MLDCAIVGGGPAGLSAGLYATRGGLKNVVLFEMGLPGGQITQSSEIENYPGFFDHTKTGMDFMETWQEQCFHFGLKHEMVKIVRVEKKDSRFLLTAEGGESWEAKTVIVCTGSTPKRAGFKGEEEFFGKGVSTCATCDGFFYKDREVAVVGGGDTALEEALFLSDICAKVYIIHRRDRFRAVPSTIERVQRRENIVPIFEHVVDEVLGDETGVQGVRIKHVQTGQTQELNTPGIFVFVGHNVNNEVLRKPDGSFLCATDEGGHVKVDLRMRTDVEGLFAGGDLRTEAPRQVVCAAGDGAVAALSVLSYLQEQR